ncbi:MAG: TusE/DsrC/DsvC family sulfur relay protein [Burkholderiales bacterium]|nr:TusE/DsrC/DsvC family sulfur relay protein [Burkholderiales bacterium]
MLDSQRDPIHPDRGAQLPKFPHAPIGWMPSDARLAAKEEDLILTEVHWQVIRALQSFYARHDETGIINRIELNDALDEKFHHQGGIKFLDQHFPKGPVAQGCRMAGLTPPAGAVDLGFGSVM